MNQVGLIAVGVAPFGFNVRAAQPQESLLRLAFAGVKARVLNVKGGIQHLKRLSEFMLAVASG